MNSVIENAIGNDVGNTAIQSQARDGPLVIVDDDPYDALRAAGFIDELQPTTPAQILTSGEVYWLISKEMTSTMTEASIPIRAWSCWI